MNVVEVEPQLVCGIRKKGPYKLIAELLPKIYEYAESKGAEFTGSPVFVCHETAEQAMEANEKANADVEVGAPIAKKIEETDEIKCYTLAGGKMVKTIHKGPYEDCGPTYEKMFKWIIDNGYAVTGPTREYYLNDPREVSPKDILTEIYAPIT